MAKPIKQSIKSDLVFIHKGNYELLYTSILRVLGKEAPFAPLMITGTKLSWTTATLGTYQSFDKAPADLLGTLLILWEQLKVDLLKKLSPHKLDFVLEVPDMSYLFYIEDSSADDAALGHKYKLMITGWACRANTKGNEGQLAMKQRMNELQGKHQNVIVKMLDSNNVPLSNQEFIYKYGEDITRGITTDALGYYNQGICVVGSNLTYIYQLTGQSQKIVVQKNIEEYPITFAPTTTVNIKVVDQFHNPIQSHPIQIEYGTKNFNVKTDGLGNVQLTNLLYLDSSLQLNVNVEGLGHNTYGVECPVTNILMTVEITPEATPYLKVMRGGDVVANHSIRLTGKIVGTYATNSEGCISLDGLKWGDSFSAESTINATAGIEHYIISDKQTEYIYNLPIESETTTKNCFLKVLDKVSLTPQTKIPIEINSQNVQGQCLTDDAGIIELGMLPIGANFIATYNKKSTSFIIEEECSEYILYIEKEDEQVNAYIKVVKGTDMNPVPNYPLKIEAEGFNGLRITDEAGKIELGSIKTGSTITATTTEKETISTSFIVSKEQDEYLMFLPEDGQRDFSAHIKVVEGEEGIPVENYSLRIESETMSGNFLTDTYGILPLNNVVPGMQVVCNTGAKDSPFIFEIEEDKEEYLIRIDAPQKSLLGDIMVTFVDKDKITPITPATITLTNKQKQQFVQTNDYNGNIVVPRSFFTHNEKVLFHAEHNQDKIRDCKFKFVDDCDHYVISLVEDRFQWRKLLWLLLLPAILLLSLIGCERDITVHTIDTNGNNVGGTMVQLKYSEHALYKNKEFFYNRSQYFQGMTNNDGYYTFNDVPCSVYSYIFYCFQKALANGSRNALSGGSSKFLFHWRKNVDIVISTNKLVQVRDRNTNQPVAQARVDVNRYSKERIDSTMLTNNQGYCTIMANYTKPTNQIAQLTATKVGYSGTRLYDVNFDVNDSLPIVIYLDYPDPCRDKEENNNSRNKGNLAMRDYDMGVEGGEFTFNYYTDSAPDEIWVYDGSSSDYVNGSAPCIFHYAGATYTTDYDLHETIKFESRYICVVVGGGTNWGYIVQCPFAE